MTPQEIFNCEIIKELQEIQTKTYLLIQTLSAQLPTTKPVIDDGYFTDPKTGKRLKYGARPKGKKRKLHLIKKEVSNEHQN